MNIAIAFVTIERPHAAQRLIRSVRRFLGDLPIYVADQSARIDAMSAFYESNRVTVVRMPFDSGLAASRNALVREIREDFFLLCDDDFVLGPCSDLDDAVTVLENAPDIAVVGGRLHDYDDTGERVRNWEMYFQYDRRNRSFTAIPIYNYSPAVRSVAGIDVYLCDAVMNFCVFRRTAFSDCIRWDDRIKINGEHEDFFLNLKLNSQWKVAYLPSMAALHHHPMATGSYESALRSRQEGWTHFLEKWGIDQHLEIGTGVRALEPSAQRWFVDAGAPQAPAKARVCEVMLGQTPMLPEAGIAFMRLRSLLSGPGDPRPPWVTSKSSLRSLLDPADDLVPYEATAPLLRFCYSQDAVGSSLLLWCRSENTDTPQTKKRSWFAAIERKSLVRARVALRFRWFDHQGKSLVWESERIEVELYDEGYWRPIVAPVPLWPTSAPHLRFEIVAERDEDRVPIAIGFLFAETSGRIREPGGEVMALSLPRPGAALPGPTQPPFEAIADAGSQTRVLKVIREESPSKATIDLTQGELLDVRTLIFLDWKSTGWRLATLDTLQTSFQLASRIEIPRSQGDACRVLGILKNGECSRFELAV